MVVGVVIEVVVVGVVKVVFEIVGGVADIVVVVRVGVGDGVTLRVDSAA